VRRTATRSVVENHALTMLDFEWEVGKGDSPFTEICIQCPNCEKQGVYYETKIQGQVCCECNKEFEGVVTMKLVVTVKR